MICSICGKHLNKAEAVLRLIPLDVLDWTSADMGSFEVNMMRHMLMNDCGNMLYVHRECMPEEVGIVRKIGDYICKASKRANAMVLANRLKYNIGLYEQIRHETWTAGEGKCACCGQPVEKEKFVLRRADQNRGFVPENASAVCLPCHSQSVDTSAKGA